MNLGRYTRYVKPALGALAVAIINDGLVEPQITRMFPQLTQSEFSHKFADGVSTIATGAFLEAGADMLRLPRVIGESVGDGGAFYGSIKLATAPFNGVSVSNKVPNPFTQLGKTPPADQLPAGTSANTSQLPAGMGGQAAATTTATAGGQASNMAIPSSYVFGEDGAWANGGQLPANSDVGT